MAKAAKRVNFIRQIINNDLRTGTTTAVHTRFPPEPNGYLHLGHAKSICLNFSLADELEGQCNLRFDDTNPLKEDNEFVEAIQKDVEWLGFEWGKKALFSSDYFETLYNYALELIDKGLAYVDSQSADEMRANRGTLTEQGIDSVFRSRSIAENRTLFTEMRAGKHAEGSHILRAKIDMQSPNINLRDPAIYRIRHTAHHRTGNDWCIYPMYDYTHCISDAIEGISHSLCTLEFADHRPLYDWFLDNISIENHPKQIEFSRLNLDYTIMSKRLLTRLVEEGHVSGWDDPRMPTISGIRRRGYTAASIRDFAERIGVTKKENIVELSYLESCLREELEPKAHRVMAVLDPIKITLSNYPEGQIEQLNARNHPKDECAGSRELPFARTLYIERDDFMEHPPEGFYRLAQGKEVRLRYAYNITCDDVIKNEAGEPIELICRYHPETRKGGSSTGEKVRGIIHWVAAPTAVSAETRVYDRLFLEANPLADKSKDFTLSLNPDSLRSYPNCKLEPSLDNADTETHYQFERLGYFKKDNVEESHGNTVFNRVVSLRDTWAKQQRKS